MSLGKDAEDKEGPEEIRGGGEGTCLLNICMLQREGSIVTGFKDSDRIEGISEVSNGMKVHCNTGEVVSNKVGSWGKLKAWHLPDFIANIISVNMNELEQHNCVTYDSWNVHYIVHTEHGPVHFMKDEHGLP